MAIFDLGDLITTLLLLFLVLYFRARDSNNRSVEDLRRFLDTTHSNLEARFESMIAELEERTVDMQAQRDLNIEFMRRGEQSYQNFIESVKGLEASQQRMEELFTSVQHYSKELEKIGQQFRKVEEDTEQIHKLDNHLKEQRNWATELQNHLIQKMGEQHSLLRNDFSQYAEEQKDRWNADSTGLTTQFQELEKNLALQAEALKRVYREHSEWEKVEQSLQADAEQFHVQQQHLQQEIENTAAQNAQLAEQIANRQTQVQQTMSQLQDDCQKLQSVLEQEGQRQQQELQAHLEQNFGNLQQKQNRLFEQKCDNLMLQSMEQVQQRLSEFEQWCSAYFEKFSDIEADIQKDRNSLLSQFRIEMQTEMEEQRQIFGQQAANLLHDWETLSGNYRQLQSELESIEKRSQGEIKEKFELYEKHFIEELQQRQSQLTEHLQQWDGEQKNQLAQQSSQAQQNQAEAWERSRETWERQVAVERRNLKEQLRLSKQQIQSHETEAEREIRELMETLKQEVKLKQESISQQNKEHDLEIRKRLDEYGSELEQWMQKFQQMERDMYSRSQKLEDQYETLEGRIQTDVQQMANNFETIEQQQQHILSNGKLIERAERLWRETREQIARLREQSSTLHSYAEQAQHLEKEFSYIRQLAHEGTTKLQTLETSEERAETLQQNIGHIEQTLEQNQNSWEQLYNQSERIQKMEEYLRQIEDVYTERGKEFMLLEEQAQNLLANQSEVLTHIGELKDFRSRIHSIENILGPLEKKANELSHLQQIIEENSAQSTKAVEQISLLENLLKTAAERLERFQKLRNWSVQAEERIQTLSDNLDTNIHLAEQVALQQGNLPGPESGNTDLTRVDEETRTMVFQLAEKGWDNTTIAKQLNISVGAVELILEMSSLI